MRIPLDATDVESANRRFLLYGVLPLWFAPSVADWVMHRRTRIEQTTGVRESLIHLLMMAEAGVPMTLGLLARINPLVLSTMGGAAALHGATAVWDVTVATSEREVRPVEQHIHSFLEVLPLTATAFVACLHWDQVRAMVRGGGDDAWRLLPKDQPLPTRYLAGLAAGVALFVALPYGEELMRCLRTKRAAG
ncbi:diguanylate cyclase [Streptomyces silvisoli]|uniref:Diguanylate cyclase n=1 Tax=Streptomyces silvisoli TaxID=3034235 RepID=A0ABT5ZD79_9ACTN|nr:diguanylate cyclase [Streptomyces silvisoli]MDF3287774.1 diguanylate cyclase [Streptomyces silvisoli]